MTYDEYVQVEQLLRLQRTVSDVDRTDELTFLIAHQSAELALKLLNLELDRLGSDSMGSGVDFLRCMEKVNLLVEMLVDHLMLCGFVPRDVFFGIREKVFPASAQESKQFQLLLQRLACEEGAEEKSICKAIGTALARAADDAERDLLKERVRKFKGLMGQWRKVHRDLAAYYLEGLPGARTSGVTFLEERQDVELLPGLDLAPGR